VKKKPAKQNDPILLVRKMYKSNVTTSPYIFDMWKLEENLFYVFQYGLSKYHMRRCETELEAVLEFQHFINCAREGFESLEQVKSLSGTRMLDAKNPVWKWIRKNKNSYFSIPWNIN
jgi:hypothetical protein